MREWLVMVGWVGGLAAGAVRRRCCYPGRVGSAGGGGGGVLRGKGRRRNETEAVEVGFFALLRRRGVAKTGGRSSAGFGFAVSLGCRCGRAGLIKVSPSCRLNAPGGETRGGARASCRETHWRQQRQTGRRCLAARVRYIPKEADPGFGLVCVQLGMRAISEPPEIRGGLGRLPTDVSGGWWLWLVVQWMVCVLSCAKVWLGGLLWAGPPANAKPIHALSAAMRGWAGTQR